MVRSVSKLALLCLPTLLLIASTAASEPNPEPAVHYDDWQGVQKRIAENDGKLTVVNIWTTTCPGCLEEFPKFAALLNDLHDDGLRGIAVNCDYDGVPGKPPKWYAPKVVSFLKQHPSPRTDVILTDPLLDFLDAEEIPSTPATYVYDGDGKLLKRFAFDPSQDDDHGNRWETVERFVRKQLARR